MALVHHEIVRESAEAYLAHVDSLIATGNLEAKGQEAAEALRVSLQNGLASKGKLQTADVPFTAALLKPCSPGERAALVNQWSLGLGSDAAPVVVMGTEHAYDLNEYPVGLALESCASALLWLDDGGPELAAWIAQDPTAVSDKGQSFHRHPTAHYKVGGGHTWNCVSQVLGVSLDRLGDYAYQVERSAHPAQEALNGAAPTRERREFLVNLLRMFRRSARVLIVHGKTNTAGDEWQAANKAFSAAFLGQEPAEFAEWQVGKAYIRRWRAGDRTVFHTWALNGNALAHGGSVNAYLEQLRELVEPALAA